MKLRINLKQALAAAALVSTAAFTVACSSAAAGTPSAGTAAASTSTSSSIPTPTDDPANKPTGEPTRPSNQTSRPTTTIEVDDPTVVAADLDATTEAWLANSCTDVQTLIAALFAYPTVDGTASDEEYRDAYVEYYSALTDTLFDMTDRMSALDAPNIPGGQDLHDGYTAYLDDLSSITLGAAVLIQSAPDRASVDAAIEQVNAEIEQLQNSDYGLSDFQSDELQELMAQVPACEPLLNS